MNNLRLMAFRNNNQGKIPGWVLMVGVLLISIILVIVVWWYYHQRIEAINQMLEQ